MNKLYFEGNVVDLYSADYQYLQDSIDSSLTHLLYSIFSRNIDSGGLIFGFSLSISSTDVTKLQISHAEGAGAVINKSGHFLYSTTEFDDLSLSDETLGITNYVFAKCDYALGSFNRKTLVDVENEKLGVDFSTYQSVYNRQLDKLSIEVLTKAEFNALTTAEQQMYVFLGSVVGQGGGPLLSVDLDEVNTLYVTIADKSILVKQLADTFKLPQYMALATSTGKINDDYTLAPQTLEDDLNLIRSNIKSMKGVSYWTAPTPGTLLNFDTAINSVHLNGIVASYGNKFALDFTTVGSTNIVIINSGKVLHLGNVRIVPENTTLELPLTELEYAYLGNWTDKTEFEYVDLSNSPYSITLQKYTDGFIISPDNFHAIYDDTGEELAQPNEISLDSSTGIVTAVSFSGRTPLRLFYKYTSRRYDAIDVLEDGTFSVTTSTLLEAKALPPAVPKNAYRLYVIERKPFVALTPFSISDCRTYLQNVSYNTSVFMNQKIDTPFAVEKITYYTSTGEIDTTGSQWNVGTLPGQLDFGFKMDSGRKLDISTISVSYVTCSTLGASLITEVYAQEGDSLYIVADKTEGTGSLLIEYESITGTGNLDSSATINLYNYGIILSECLIPAIHNLSMGYHRIKITTLDSASYKLYKIIIGKLQFDLFKDNLDITNVIKSSSLQAVGGVESTDTGSGDLLVAGGAGITKNLNVGGTITTSNYIYGNIVPTKATKNASYDITDTDYLQKIYADTTSGPLIVTLPLKANNTSREIHIQLVSGTNTLTIVPHASDPNTLSTDGLASIILSKIGNRITLCEDATSGKWLVSDEQIVAELNLDTYAGYGSTDSCIMKFTNKTLDIGNCFTHNHGAYGVHGLEVTIVKSGRYSIAFTGSCSTTSINQIGISLNSASLATNISSIPVAEHIAIGTAIFVSSVGYSTCTAVTKYLKKGDIIRPHCSANVPASTALNSFIVTYLG